MHGASPQRAAFLRQQLEALQLAVTTLAISREPWLSDIEQGVQLAREKGIRAVVSLGGGAVIDAGKAIAALVPAAGPVIDYLEVVGTGRQLEASPLPFVAIPHHRWHGRGGHQKCGDQRSGTAAESEPARRPNAA
ncbi:iron-containing alcohol dehydrogenase [Klebsiella pneumoniae subsp. pneumoniae]|nr:iron-containing alcohol dehydrogenase [Klebsiella pneumoniae subsp. pneumoniae]